MNRRNVGWALLGVAVVLLIAGFGLRNGAEDDVYMDREVDELLYGSSELKANQTPSIVAFVAAGAAAVAAAFLLLSELPRANQGRSATARPEASVQNLGTVEELSRLTRMHERGELADDEFEAAKRRVLGL